MGFYKFTWPYPAGQVLVTGEFDEWRSSVKLEKDGETGTFSAVVDLGDSDKTFYKYIVDGNWTTNNTEKIERDSSGIENNVLYKADMYAKTEEPAAPLESVLIQSAAPVATTVTLAAAVPYETEATPSAAAQVAGESQTLLTSSVAPASTTAVLAAQVPYESRETSQPEYERPTPGFSDVPGGFPETPAVDEATTFQVNPFPAYSTAGNPITLAPGEPVPTFTTAAVHDTLTLDKESYEKADASNLGAGFDFTSIPAAVSSQNEDSLIPESSLPILPAAAENVPGVVKESQAIANASPEASASETVVEKKDAMEQELISNPPNLHHTEAVAANSVPDVVKKSLAIAHASPEASASEELVQQKDDIEHELITSPPHLHHHKEEVVAASNVPDVVAESQAIANASPEASANETLVQKKDAIEHELVASPPHLEHVQDKTLAEQIKDEPAVLASSLIDDAQPTIRAVEPEVASENIPPSTTGNRPSSPAALATPPVATTTTSTFTTPVPGTTTFTSVPKASSTTSADSTPKSDDDTKEKISGEFDKGSDKRKEKRRSYIFTRIRNLFR